MKRFITSIVAVFLLFFGTAYGTTLTPFKKTDGITLTATREQNANIAALQTLVTNNDATTATVAEINQAADQSAQVLTPGAGFAGVGTVYKTSIIKHGDIIKTTIFIDLTGTSSSTTDLDIIGTSGVSHIGQITAAKNGTLFYGQITCLETPAGGIADIDLYSATEGTGAFDGAIGSLVETAMLTKGGNWSAAAATQQAITTMPAAGKYMYLTGGAAGTAAAYTAGQFMIELWGF